MLDLHDPNEQAADQHLLRQESAALIEEAAAKWVDENPVQASDIETAVLYASPQESEQIASAIRKNDDNEAGRLLRTLVRRTRKEDQAEQMAMNAEDGT